MQCHGRLSVLLLLPLSLLLGACECTLGARPGSRVPGGWDSTPRGLDEKLHEPSCPLGTVHRAGCWGADGIRAPLELASAPGTALGSQAQFPSLSSTATAAPLASRSSKEEVSSVDLLPCLISLEHWPSQPSFLHITSPPAALLASICSPLNLPL